MMASATAVAKILSSLPSIVSRQQLALITSTPTSTETTHPLIAPPDKREWCLGGWLVYCQPSSSNFSGSYGFEAFGGSLALFDLSGEVVVVVLVNDLSLDGKGGRQVAAAVGVEMGLNLPQHLSSALGDEDED